MMKINKRDIIIFLKIWQFFAWWMLMIMSTGTVIGIYLKMDFPLSIGNKVLLIINFVMVAFFAYVFYMESKIRSRDFQFTNISSIVQALQFVIVIITIYYVEMPLIRAVIYVFSMFCTSLPLTIKVYKEIKKIEKQQIEKVVKKPKQH